MLSTILATATRIIVPLLMIFSFFLLLRGHNEPGGGFVGGLVAATAYALYSISNGIVAARNLLKTDPVTLIAAGLLTALTSALIPMFMGDVFMTGKWFDTEIPIIGKVGTPLLFDIGVYLVVLGIALKIIFTLSEEEL